MSFTLFVFLGGMWSLATPLNGAPDELAQTIKAAALVRGQWIGVRQPGDRRAFTTVQVPAVFADFGNADCVRGHPAVPAGTCPVTPGSSRVVPAATYVGHYPPLYYLLVGWPSLLATRSSIYLMRAASVVVNSLFLALAVAVAWRWSRSRVLVAALGVAITPMAVFLSGVINPSGLETTAAVAMWTAGAVMVVDTPDHPPPGLVAVLTAAVCVELLVRGDSPLWPVAALLVMIPLGWGRFRLWAFLSRRAFWLGAAAAVASGVAALVWLVVGRPLTVASLGAALPGTPGSALARTAVGDAGALLHQMVGVFGYLHTPSPLFTYLAWAMAAGAVVMMAVLVGDRRVLAGLAVAVVLAVGVPFGVIFFTARQSSLDQGRYFLPLVVSIPIVCGVGGAQPGLPDRAAARWSAVVVALACAGQAAAGVWALRRYLVGVRGPLLPTARVPGAWHPPVPGWSLDLGFLAGWAAVAALARLASRPAPVGRPSPAAHRARPEPVQAAPLSPSALLAQGEQPG